MLHSGWGRGVRSASVNQRQQRSGCGSGLPPGLLAGSAGTPPADTRTAGLHRSGRPKGPYASSGVYDRHVGLRPPALEPGSLTPRRSSREPVLATTSLMFHLPNPLRVLVHAFFRFTLHIECKDPIEFFLSANFSWRDRFVVLSEGPPPRKLPTVVSQSKIKRESLTM